MEDKDDDHESKDNPQPPRISIDSALLTAPSDQTPPREGFDFNEADALLPFQPNPDLRMTEDLYLVLTSQWDTDCVSWGSVWE
jgi:hypothetical protein